MKYIYLLLLFPLIANAQSEELDYDQISSILIADSRPNILNLGVNYEIASKVVQGSYTINNYFFVFGTYNFENTTVEHTSYSALGSGSAITSENHNYGYSAGGGIQNIGKIGTFKNVEYLVGYEFQKADIASHYSNSDYPNGDKSLEQKYFTLIAQFNMLRCKKNYDVGWSLRAAYFEFIENSLYAVSKTVFITPSFSFNYKILKNRALLLTSQFSTAAPTNKFVHRTGSSYQSNYILSGNIKFGIQYKFDMKKMFVN